MKGRDPSGGRPDGGAAGPAAGRPDPARMDRIALPRLNPWLALLILVLLGFGYIGLWGWLLGGQP
ncbi:hypothetical protein [Candidatus Palauibacter soopunensis]|uniref:hypothetical protein n=1 Tax=Candidatus Palauibacter soopunensis TaxID=3056739 RepID=UPI0023887A44|nr:hypothetical protein [Candidatus Palauibacter soopunensis]MDE2878987.1 hypothetical protein [Candidatus Palauibacter soopunensis]